jgi:hypothetical protein
VSAEEHQMFSLDISTMESVSIIDLNRLAMYYLSREAFKECLKLLKQAESVLESEVFLAMM